MCESPILEEDALRLKKTWLKCQINSYLIFMSEFKDTLSDYVRLQMQLLQLDYHP